MPQFNRRELDVRAREYGTMEMQMICHYTFLQIRSDMVIYIRCVRAIFMS